MNRASGFTLIELIITLAVIAVLMGIGAPSMQTAVKNGKIITDVNELTGSLQLARSESVKQSLNVAVCARGTNLSCGDDWTNGWIVFTDAGATIGMIDPDEAIIAVRDEISASTSLTNNAIIAGASGSANARNFIRFSPRGGNNWRGGGSFIFCDDRGEPSLRALNIVMSGDIRIARENDKGQKYDAFGSVASCPKT